MKSHSLSLSKLARNRFPLKASGWTAAVVAVALQTVSLFIGNALDLILFGTIVTIVRSFSSLVGWLHETNLYDSYPIVSGRYNADPAA